MPSGTAIPIEIFYSYAREDEPFRQEMEKHLKLLQRQGLINAWHDCLIPSGADRAREINTHLERASIILLLISADFLASDYCYSIEMTRALQRHKINEARVLPILVRPCNWSDAPFAHLQMLPKDALPISKWPDKDEAWTDVVTSIRHIIEDLPVLSASTPSAPRPSVWNIPYPRNPYFTGREDILSRLRTSLQTGQATALSQTQAISGLGGIGKTQIAVEYAYQHRQDYRVILWSFADTREALVAGHVAIAELLNLPQKREKDQTIIVNAVRQWLTNNTDWLLILDNADDLAMVYEFLPLMPNGHVLLTTRAQATGKRADRIVVDTMPSDAGTLLLLRRAKLIEPDVHLDQAIATDITTARSICEELGGLPLALDQAGAYIEESECSLHDYATLYRTSRSHFLKRRGALVADYPQSVATTWSLSFARVEQANPAAADLLRVCAFLAPDAIPEEIITTGATHLGPLLAPLSTDPSLLNEIIVALRAYSLIRRDTTTKTLTLHRLVQAVLRDTLDEQAQRTWIERVIRAVNATFPEVDFRTWPQCERCLPHAQNCADLVEQALLTLPEAVSLLRRAGAYLIERIRYGEADLLLQQALLISEQHIGPQHPETASTLDRLARLFEVQGKYEMAEPLYERALAIREQQLGSDHPDTATSLNNLALLYKKRGKYKEAEPLYFCAHVAEKTLLQGRSITGVM